MFYLLEYKELILNLTVSELKLKYKGSVLGFLWSLLDPLLMMMVLLIVFTRIFKFDIPNYPMYLLIGIIVWRFFSATGETLHSIVGKPNMVKKIYFPREILVLSTCLRALITSILEFSVLFALLLLWGTPLSLFVLFFPVILVVEFFLVLGLSLFLSSSYVFFRDLKNIWDVALQVGFYATPIIYPVSLISENYSILLVVNPMTQILQVFRDILLYAQMPPMTAIVLSLVYSIGFFVLGWFTFKHFEPRFAEEI